MNHTVARIGGSAVTNGDRIRSMNNKELAVFLQGFARCQCGICSFSEKCPEIFPNVDGSCVDGFERWMTEEEAENAE